MPYQGRQPGVGVRNRFIYTATGGQTLFSGADDNGRTLAYQDGAYVDVYLNGVMLVPTTDFTATTKTSITLTSGATASDVVEILAYDISSIADTVSKSQGGTFDNDITINGDLTVDTNTLFVDAANNRVGIGTSSPAVPLQVGTGANSNTHKAAFLGGFTTFENSAGTGNPSITFNNDTDTGFLNPSANTLVINTGGSERVRVDSSGRVGINRSNPSEALDVQGNILILNTGNPTMTVKTSGAGNNPSYILAADTNSWDITGIFSEASDPIRFAYNGSEKMRLDSSGNLLVGKTVADLVTDGLFLQPNGTYWANRTSDISLVLNRDGTDGNTAEFYKAGSQVGSIGVTSSATSYNTSSDYRLKEDVQPMVGSVDRLMALKPVNFAWKADGSRVDGFLAHEAQEVVPQAVTGEKDGEQMQAIDHSKLVPLLTAALQEALTKIEALEARLNALEGQ